MWSVIRPLPNALRPHRSHSSRRNFDVRTAIVITEENILTVVSAPNSVVLLLRTDDSGHAKGACDLPLAGRKVNNSVTAFLVLFV